MVAEVAKTFGFAESPPKVITYESLGDFRYDFLPKLNWRLC